MQSTSLSEKVPLDCLNCTRYPVIADPPLNGAVQLTLTLVLKNKVSGAKGMSGCCAASILTVAEKSL